MYKESFTNHMFSSTWCISVTHGMIHLIVHVTCLNVILNILPSCGKICIILVVFAVGRLLQLALVTRWLNIYYFEGEKLPCDLMMDCAKELRPGNSKGTPLSGML